MRKMGPQVFLYFVLFGLSLISSVIAGTCSISDTSKTDCGYVGITQSQCESKGCCYFPSSSSGAPWCFEETSEYCTISESSRTDCGYFGIAESDCLSKGCCWSTSTVSGTPWCFYGSASSSSLGYNLTQIEETSTGYSGVLELIGGSSLYGEDLTELSLEVIYETESRFHLKINSINKDRWEVPQEIISRPVATSKASNTNYLFTYTENPFTFLITRVSDGKTLFDSSESTLIFKDQYIQLATSIDASTSVFGLGESSRSAMKLVPGTTYTLWNVDQQSLNFDLNLYGSHPFFVGVIDGTAYGVLLLNSNGMDIDLEVTSLTYKTIGGIIDLYVFTGPTPNDVISQYTEVIGRPAMMPYWSFGFHNCRYGYTSIYEVETVANSYIAANIPIDTFWLDIDYMDEFKDFTADSKYFPADQMRYFVDNLHSTGHYFVPIIDPGIFISSGYSAYDEGISKDIFIKDLSGGYYLGQVWPGPTYYPDFTHPDSGSYWQEQIEKFNEIVPVDGLWIDMNEVSNFCNYDGAGQVCKNPGGCPTSDQTTCCLSCSTIDSTNTYDFPPYEINNSGGSTPIGYRTIAPSASLYNGTVSYNAHNLYGLTESIVTYQAIQNILNKRPFVLTRSTFAGSGKWAAHWTGDNGATWNDLKVSIITMMNMGLFGIPMVGADICGFIYDTTEELCNRWIEVGAFYPFSRDHNTIDTISQELYRWTSVTKSAQNALGMRYRLLPYLYTLFYQSHTTGSLVARALWVNFPDDQNTIAIDSQFMLGDSLLVSPVLTQGATTVTAYFPSGVWYNIFDNTTISCSSGCIETLTSDLYTVQVHVQGGAIIPMHSSGVMTTQQARASPFTLMVFLDQNYEAEGILYLDDGEQIDVDSASSVFSFISFSASKNQLTNVVQNSAYQVAASATLQSIAIKGLSSSPSTVQVNGNSATFIFDSSNQLIITGISVSITDSLNVQWS